MSFGNWFIYCFSVWSPLLGCSLWTNEAIASRLEAIAIRNKEEYKVVYGQRPSFRSVASVAGAARVGLDPRRGFEGHGTLGIYPVLTVLTITGCHWWFSKNTGVSWCFFEAWTGHLGLYRITYIVLRRREQTGRRDQLIIGSLSFISFGTRSLWGLTESTYRGPHNYHNFPDRQERFLIHFERVFTFQSILGRTTQKKHTNNGCVGYLFLLRRRPCGASAPVV